MISVTSRDTDFAKQEQLNIQILEAVFTLKVILKLRKLISFLLHIIIIALKSGFHILMFSNIYSKFAL